MSKVWLMRRGGHLPARAEESVLFILELLVCDKFKFI